ncbi:MAG: C1 family peptidase [Bacteroidota bacterium]
MKKAILILFFTISYNFILAQQYQFTPVIDIPVSSVKNQGKTGTCWSFSTTSFIESEIERISGKKIDISEMYTVRTTYDEKAWNYVMRQGNAQFSEGGLAHDLMNAIRLNGLLPQEAFTGLYGQAKGYDHSKIEPEIKEILNKYIQKDSIITDWEYPTKTILDQHIGAHVTTFSYEGKTYTPMAFLTMTKLNPDAYITLTSFTHKPYYTKFILNIPDNFSNGSFYNLPLNDYMDIIDTALKNGYTVELDIDASEPTFSQKAGVAIIPKQIENNQKGLSQIVDEKLITPDFRQAEFENFNTTDDHLMHITGIVKDQKGNKYYKVKNSWGPNVTNGGFIYISESFMQLKSISIMVHTDVIPKKIKKILEL